MTNPMYCSRCGKPADPGEHFCGRCGNDLQVPGGMTTVPPAATAPITPPSPTYQQPPTTYSYQQQTYSQNTARGSNLPLVSALVVVLVALVVVAYFLFFNKSSPNGTIAIATTPSPAAAASPSATGISLPTIVLASPTVPSANPNAGLPPIVATPMPRTTPNPGPIAVNVDKGIASKEMDVQTNRGLIVIDLYPNAAPNTIAVYENMANSGQYDGHIWHRVEDWVLQGNDPRGDGTGGGDIPTEINKIHYKAGSVGIARTSDVSYSNDSQFFIVKDTTNPQYADLSFLDGQFDSGGNPVGGYTLIGQVRSGMDIADAMQIGDKIISIRVKDIAASQSAPANSTPATAPLNTPTADQLAAAQLLVAAGANMGKLTSYHYEDTTVETISTTTQRYTISGDVDVANRTSKFGSVEIISGTTYTYNYIEVGGKQYYSTDNGATWIIPTSDPLDTEKYYFAKVSGDIPASPDSFAATISSLSSDNIGTVSATHFSVDANALYGSKAAGMDSPIEFWLDPTAKTVLRLKLRGTAGANTLAFQGQWSKFNTPVATVTVPSNIATPVSDTGTVAPATPTAISQVTPGGGDPVAAQSLLDAADAMKGFKSFHYQDNAVTGGQTYALNGDVDLTSNAARFDYNSAGTQYQLIAIGSTEYYSSDGGATWKVNTGQAILSSVNYYLKQMWGDLAAANRSQLNSSAQDLGSETIAGQPTHHLSVAATAIFGSNSSGIQGQMEFWVADANHAVLQMKLGGLYNGIQTVYQANWSDFGKSVHITAPTNIITPTAIPGLSDNSGSSNSSNVQFTSFDDVKSYHFAYTAVFTSDTGNSNLNYSGDIVRPDRAHVVVHSKVISQTLDEELILIGSDYYSRNSSGAAWNKGGDGKSAYSNYDHLISSQMAGLPSLLDSMSNVGDESIAGEPCTHYQYASGSSSALSVDLWLAKSDHRPRQIRTLTSINDEQITVSKLNQVASISAPTP